MEKRKGIDIVMPVVVVDSDEKTESDESGDHRYDSLDNLFENCLMMIMIVTLIMILILICKEV